jgi:hypothetical protein
MSFNISDTLHFVTIAELYAAGIPSGPTNARVDGYYEAGDGGQGEWNWLPDNDGYDNGGLIVNPTDNEGNGRWLRNYDGITLKPKWFGAYADGSTDDSGVFNAMIAALSPKSSPFGGGRIDLQFGTTYYLAHSWHITRPVVVVGGGMGVGGSSTILKCAAGASVVLDSTATSPIGGERGCAGSILQNFLVEGSRPPIWAPSTHYDIGDYVLQPDWYGNFTFYIYKCIDAGTSGNSPPAFVIRDLYDGMLNTEGATFIDDSVTWQAQSSPGIWMFQAVTMRNIYTESCPGDGIYMWGRVQSGTDVSGFDFYGMVSGLNLGRGLMVEGSDASAGTVNTMSCQDNYAGGYADYSDLGNLYISALAESNGIRAWYHNLPASFWSVGGIITTTPMIDEMEAQRVATDGYTYYYTTTDSSGTSGDTQPAWPTTISATVLDGTITWKCTGIYLNGQARIDRFEGFEGSTWIGCYDELDQRFSQLYQGIWIGELGGYFSYDSEIWQLKNRENTNGIGQINPSGTSTPQAISFLGTPDGEGGALYMASDQDGSNSFRIQLSSDLKYWQWAALSSTVRMLMANTAAPEGTGEIVFPNGLFLGQSGGTRASKIVMLSSAAAGNGPDVAYPLAQLGDICIQGNALSDPQYPDAWRCIQSYNPTGPVDAVWQEIYFDKNKAITTVSGTVGSPFPISYFFGATGFGATFSDDGYGQEVGILLPTVAARSGVKYNFIVEQAGAGIRVIAPSSIKIQLGTAVSSAGGYVESTSVGSFLTLESIGQTGNPIWVATSIVGTWSAS